MFAAILITDEAKCSCGPLIAKTNKITNDFIKEISVSLHKVLAPFTLMLIGG